MEWQGEGVSTFREKIERKGGERWKVYSREEERSHKYRTWWTITMDSQAALFYVYYYGAIQKGAECSFRHSATPLSQSRLLLQRCEKFFFHHALPFHFLPDKDASEPLASPAARAAAGPRGLPAISCAETELRPPEPVLRLPARNSLVLDGDRAVFALPRPEG